MQWIVLLDCVTEGIFLFLIEMLDDFVAALKFSRFLVCFSLEFSMVRHGTANQEVLLANA